MATRDENGRFTKGNTIGEETRFGEGHGFTRKYCDEYADKMLEYFLKGMEDDKIIYEERYKDGEVISKVPKMVVTPKLPTFELFAATIRVCPATIYNWKEQYPHFRDTWGLCRKIQLGLLKQNATMKAYDSAFAKFLCVNDHDMSDKVQVAGTDEKGKEAPFSVSIKIID